MNKSEQKAYDKGYQNAMRELSLLTPAELQLVKIKSRNRIQKWNELSHGERMSLLTFRLWPEFKDSLPYGMQDLIRTEFQRQLFNS